MSQAISAAAATPSPALAAVEAAWKVGGVLFFVFGRFQRFSMFHSFFEFLTSDSQTYSATTTGILPCHDLRYF